LRGPALFRAASVTNRDVQLAVRPEQERAALVRVERFALGVDGQIVEDWRDIGGLPLALSEPHDPVSDAAIWLRRVSLRIVDVHVMIRGNVWVQRQSQKPALGVLLDGEGGDGLLLQDTILLHDAHTAREYFHEELPAVWREGHGRR
jgi:hypothetical protein